MATRDHDPFKETETKAIRRAREHFTGIIVPRWWRGNVAILVGVVAVVSVIFAAVILDQAAERVTEQKNADNNAHEQSTRTTETNGWYRSKEAPSDLPLEAVARVFSSPEAIQQETQQVIQGNAPDGEPSRAYEEPLPGEVYEEAPVVPDASGPRITIPEEYIPESDDENEPIETTDLTGTEHISDPHTDLAITPYPDDIPDIDIKPFEHALLEQQQAWLANAIPFSPDDLSLSANAPMIAIVIDDMGVDLHRAPRAIALPGPLTLSFLTYAHDLDAQTRAALDAGHELMIHIPMEPESSTIDPGPNVLRVEDSVETTLEHLKWGLDQFDGYVGLNNHMGSKFTQNSSGMRAVLEEVRERGLLFLDSRTASGSVAAKIAQKIGVPFATRNVFLDHVDDENEIRLRLAQTERLARKNGAVVAIGHPHDKTLKVLEEWLPTVAAKGFVLVPMSELVRRTWLKEQ
ncbi:MAG: divergent polysaccharide deacetylase family protein [Rhodospirillales bacterium]|nr:divergent polysaccharide deacetylase family protein [Rhodospirillales bacterium]